MNFRSSKAAITLLACLNGPWEPATAQTGVKRYEAQELKRREQLRQQRNKNVAQELALQQKISPIIQRTKKYIESTYNICRGDLYIHNYQDDDFFQVTKLSGPILETDIRVVHKWYGFERNTDAEILNTGITGISTIVFGINIIGTGEQKLQERSIKNPDKGWSPFSMGSFWRGLLKDNNKDSNFWGLVTIHFYRDGSTRAKYANMNTVPFTMGFHEALREAKFPDFDKFINGYLPSGPTKFFNCPPTGQRTISISSLARQASPTPAGPAPESSFDTLIADARRGDPVAQVNLGTKYYRGVGAPQDYKLAAEWIRKAAEQGNADAQAKLGTMYSQGRGVEQNYSVAAEWMLKAAEQGDQKGQLKLGAIYYSGEGVPQNHSEAARWLEKAAEGGDIEVQMAAQGLLGVIYYKGQGVPKDFSKAAARFAQAAEKGSVESQAMLGIMYSEGEGVPKDLAKAAEWLRKAAAQGSDDAKSALAELGL